MNNELVVFNPGEQAFSSMKCDSFEQRAAFFNAINSPDEKLRDHINETLYIKDVFCEQVVSDEGQIAYRCVFIDVNGVSYNTMSAGVFSSLKRIMSVFGAPTWEDGLPIKVKQINMKEKQVLTLAISK